MAARSLTFADRLKSLREAAGLSQYALAKLSGLSKQALSRLEMGEREPGWDTVQRLAAALGASCESFIDPNIQEQSAERGKEVPRSRGRPPKQQAEAGQVEQPPKKPRGRPRKR